MADAASAPVAAIVPEQIVVPTALPDTKATLQDREDRKKMDIRFSVKRPNHELTLRFPDGLNAFSAAVAGKPCDYRATVHVCPLKKTKTG